MVISETTKIETEPEQRQAYLPYYAISALKQERLSKGLVAYEAIMLANTEYGDSLQQIRSRVVGELEKSLGGLSWEDEKKKIISARLEMAREDLILECEYVEKEALGKHATTTYLPLMLTEQFTFQRGLGELITDSLVWVHASPWSSRTDLIQDVLDLTALARGQELDEEDVSDFVIDVMTGRSTTYFAETLQPLHEAVMGDAPYQPVDDSGVRTDEFVPAVEASVDESVDGDVSAWANEYDWEAVELTPESELELSEAQVKAARTSNTRKQRVPVVYGRLNAFGRNAGEYEVDEEDKWDAPPSIDKSSIENNVKQLYLYNDSVEAPTEATLARYVTETVELMRESPQWRESFVHQLFDEGFELPRQFLVPKKDSDGQPVRDDNGDVVFEAVKPELFGSQFEYLPASESLWEMERAVVEEKKAKFQEKAESLRNPEPITGTTMSEPSATELSRAKAFEKSVARCEAVLERFDEMGV